MDPVLIFLVLLAGGSAAALLVVPRFLDRIEPSGRVNFFGIKFLG